MGLIEQISSRPPSTLRGVLGRPPPLSPRSLSIAVSVSGRGDLTRSPTAAPSLQDIEWEIGRQARERSYNRLFFGEMGVRDLKLFAEAVTLITVLYDGPVVPGALLLLGSGTW